MNQAVCNITVGSTDDEEYEKILFKFKSRINGLNSPLFLTDAKDLWEAYLAGFPESERQNYVCHCCKTFIRRYGSLVVVNDDGTISSALWSKNDDAPYSNMEAIVRKAKIKSVFLSSNTVLGIGESGKWRHLSVSVPKKSYRTSTRSNNIGKQRAEKNEDVKNVRLALNEYSIESLTAVLNLLKSGAVYRAERVLGQAQWLYDLKEASVNKVSLFNNLLWRAVADAPAGFCHPRSSMLGKLLEDINNPSLDVDDVLRKFKSAMNPLNYQRPKADPSAQTVAQAEKIFEDLGLRNSLRRRFAKLEEIQAIWRFSKPTEIPREDAGVFTNVKTKGDANKEFNLIAPSTTITFNKFASSILPDAIKIEAYIPSTLGDFVALVDAADVTAPILFQWDNAFSYYRYATRQRVGSAPHAWGLNGGTWCNVTAVSLAPHMWSGGELSHQGKEAFYILEGAMDTNTKQGIALFPDTLKSELHSVRSVIEAYSKSAVLEGRDEGSACGIGVFGARIRVTTKLGTSEYIIDRWD